jgi:large subunit ribosomal protein L17
VANRRLVASRLINQADETKKLFAEIAPKYKETQGGYTRITKLGARLSDAAPMAIIEFV